MKLKTMSKKYDLYISYSRADYDGARMIVDVLQKQGYSCFVDFDELDAGEIEKQLFEAINNSRCLLLVYSQHVESSQFIRREVEFAIENGTKVLPILLSEFKEVSWYKERFSTINCIKLCNVEPSETRKQLLYDVSRIIGESEKRKLYSEDDYESMSNCAPSSSNNAENANYKPNHTTDRNVYPSKRSKRGCIIVSVILLVTTIGFFFSTWFVRSSPPSPSFNETVYDDDDSDFEDFDSEYDDTSYDYVFADSIMCDSTEYYSPYDESTEYEDTPPVEVDSADLQESESEIHSDPIPEFSDNSQSPISDFFALPVILIIFVLGGYIIYKHRKSKRKNVKITCNKSTIINIDGNPVAELEAHKVHTVHLSKGRYIVDFQLMSDKSKHETMPVNVDKVSDDIIVEGKFHSLLNARSTIKIFIAGSVRLVAERDALRSVIGQMYNKYKEDNLLIEAYSFDDFPREFTEGGHQKLYDEFIRQEANWVVFITDGEMGEKTIWELENAINAYKSDKRPKILMYSKPEKTQSSLQMSSFRKLLLEENQYWIDYTSLNDIKTSFRDHLQWDLYNLMKSQYKKIS